jgi:hypothetical protein
MKKIDIDREELSNLLCQYSDSELTYYSNSNNKEHKCNYLIIIKNDDNKNFLIMSDSETDIIDDEDLVPDEIVGVFHLVDNGETYDSR